MIFLSNVVLFIVWTEIPIKTCHDSVPRSVAEAEQVRYDEAAGKLLQLLILQDPERGDGGRGHQHCHQPRQLQCR